MKKKDHLPAAEPAEKAQLKKSINRIGVSVICAVGAMYAVVFLLTFIMMMLDIFGFIGLSDQAYVVVSELISCVGAYVAAPLVMWLILKPMPVRRIRPTGVKAKTYGRWILIALGLDISLAYISSAVISLYSLIFGINSSGLLDTSSDVPFYITILTTVILAPVVEEIMFRSILFKRLLPMGEVFAIVMSAVAFGLFHMNLYQFFYAAALGLFFGAVIVKTGKLIYTVGLHMVINFLGSVETMWLSDLPLLAAAYNIFLLLLMVAGVVLLMTDVYKKDGTQEAAVFYKRTGCAKALGYSAGMITCAAVMLALTIAMTFALMVM